MKKTKLRQQIYDEETSEILRDEPFNPKKKRLKRDIFYLEYAERTAKDDVTLTPVMRLLVLQMDRKDNRLYLTSEFKHALAAKYGITINAIDISLLKMHRKAIAIRTGASVYFVNPHYFTKANNELVLKLRKEFDTVMSVEVAKRKIEQQKKDLEKQLELEKAGNAIMNNVAKILSE